MTTDDSRAGALVSQLVDLHGDPMPSPEDKIAAVELARIDLRNATDSIELYQERIAELELQYEDVGWIRQNAQEEREFSRDGMRRMVRLSRFSFLKNPLLNHAVRVQADYVWGQGVTINADNEELNDFIQTWLNDRRNKQEFTGHRARQDREIQLQVEGNLFIALFTDPSNGWVRPRFIHVDEIEDIITNPEDRAEPWYYKRVSTVYDTDPESLDVNAEKRVEYYPDWLYTPKSRPDTFGREDSPVNWDAPMYHVKVGAFADMRFGIPEIYSALDWARAVKADMEDYATLRRALSRFAWNLSVKGGKVGIAATKQKLSTTLSIAGGNAIETNPPPVTGSTFISSDGADLQPIKTAGATPSPEEGRRLWLMVSAGTGIPETILSGDANVGTYATAKSLDRPTELKMANRQVLWADMIRDILQYVIECQVRAPGGQIAGDVTPNKYTGEDEVHLDLDGTTASGDELRDKPVDQTFNIRFPNILEREVLPRVQAIVQAATLNGQANAGTMDDKTLAKLLLSALGEDDVDEMLGELFADNELTTDLGQPKVPMLLTGDQPQLAPGGQPGTVPIPAASSKPVPANVALVAALRDFKEEVSSILPFLTLMEQEPEDDEFDEASGVYTSRKRTRFAATSHQKSMVDHMTAKHPTIKTDAKTAGQLKSHHATAHANGKPDHVHTEPGLGFGAVVAVPGR